MLTELDEKILGYAIDRPSQVIDPKYDMVSVEMLAKELKIETSALNARLGYLKKDQLITISTGGTNSFFGSGPDGKVLNFISSITPQGREVYRAKTSQQSWRALLRDHAYKVIGAVITAVIATVVISNLGLKE